MPGWKRYGSFYESESPSMFGPHDPNQEIKRPRVIKETELQDNLKSLSEEELRKTIPLSSGEIKHAAKKGQLKRKQANGQKLTKEEERLFGRTGLKLHIGCGPHRIDDWVNCDMMDGPAVDVVCTADKLPWQDGQVDEILTEHLIEHLTFYDFNRALAEWHRVLNKVGRLTIECPDLLGICKQFIEENEYNRYQSFKGSWPLIAHFYGHQRGRDRDEELSQVHKSGYTKEHLTTVLEGIGFFGLEWVEPQKGPPGSATLRVRAYKK